MADLALSITWEALQCEQWTEEQLSQLQGRWEDMDLFGPVEGAFPVERVSLDEAVSHCRKSYEAREIFGTSSAKIETLEDRIEDIKERYPKFWAWKSSWSYQEQLYYMRMSQALLESWRAVKSTGALFPELKKYDDKIKGIEKQTDGMYKHFLLGRYGGSSDRRLLITFANSENARRMVVIAIALKRYQLRNGKYPPDLNALIPEFLEKIPTDLMDGKPLRYQPRPNGKFLLYSVGEDGEDNNGDPTSTEPAFTKYKNWLKGRDTVWPQPATPEEIEASRTNSISKTPPAP